jgi:hypothetical protein
LVKTRAVCGVKIIALVCRDEGDFRPTRQVDRLVEHQHRA